MKKLLFIPILFLASRSWGWDVIVKDGVAECLKCETYQVFNSTTGQTDTVVVASSAPATIVAALKAESFNGNRDKWLAEINKRLNETYAAKRAREYPLVGDQLDAIWKIILGQEDAQSDAVKAKIQAVKAKYPKEGG